MDPVLITDIKNRFARIGIPFREDTGADIAVYNEFLDAGWSTGSKKILYEASILADESLKTVFMYEKTTETGQGFSFGSSNSSFTQSGVTLLRKVKSVQYGPDGRAYEYTFDLGAIPKAVKESALSNGWKFRTVLSKDKTMRIAQFGNSQNSGLKFCTNCGAQIGFGSRFCASCGRSV
ncbi:MAG: zinc ribbon domain-containing protein [Clostridia bacterium]|jgi:hypothetical protein